MTAGVLVSIITPSFNQAKFLLETLRSVELQRYRPIQQIVIDGGSSDGTVPLLQEWASADHGSDYFFEWISEPDRGHADALNKGFARAKGDIIGWLNSDDVYFDRETITTSVEALQSYPEADVVFGDVALISESSGLQMIWCFPSFDYGRALRTYTIPQPTVFFRRCITDEYRLDPVLKVAPDYAYWLMIGRKHRFHKINRVQAGDRDHVARQTNVNEALWQHTARRLGAEFGARQIPSRLAVSRDLVWKALMRIKGLARVVALIVQTPDSAELAFPAWIDNPAAVIRRQLTMRLGNREDLGPRPAGRPA